MCGIAGFFSTRALPLERVVPRLHAMQRSLRNRGPDDRGWVVFGEDGLATDRDLETGSAPSGPVHAGLVHTRLSILDLSQAGHQPMSSPDGSQWIVYNGEVYNYRAIRDELKGEGFSFRSNSDTEVVLAAWTCWGPEALQKLNGMFAFVVYDARRRELFAARDRIGIKPLYYFASEGLFLFASDATTLIASGLYEPAVDWEGVLHGIAFKGAPRPLTVYRGVRALAPGHALHEKAPPASPRPRRYWDLPVDEILSIGEHEAVEELDRRLHRALERCLVSDVEVGTLMSGGVDSTTLSAIAAKLHPRIRAFTLTPAASLGADSELEEAREAAAMHSMRHVVSEVTEDDFLAHFDEMADLFEEPIGALEPHYPISKHIAQHGIKVILNGLGPDELLAGYTHYYNLARYWLPLHRVPGLAWLPSLPRLRTVKRMATAADPLEVFYRTWSNYVFEDKRVLLPGVLPRDAMDSLDYARQVLLGRIPSKDPFQAISYADVKLHIGTHHNHTTDRFLMHFGIEGRFPYLDHELVEFLFRLPGDLKLRRGTGKYVLKKLAARYIPRSCLEMKKKGFGLPAAAVAAGRLRGRLVERIGRLRAREIFRPDVLDRAVLEMQRDKQRAQRAIYFANFEYWYERYIERKHPLFAP